MQNENDIVKCLFIYFLLNGYICVCVCVKELNVPKSISCFNVHSLYKHTMLKYICGDIFSVDGAKREQYVLEYGVLTLIVFRCRASG